MNKNEAGPNMGGPKGFKFRKGWSEPFLKFGGKKVGILRFTVPKDGDYEKIVDDAAGEIDDYLKDVKGQSRNSDGDERVEWYC